MKRFIICAVHCMLLRKMLAGRGIVGHMGPMKNAYTILVRTSEYTRPPGRPSKRRVVYVWMNLKKISFEDVNCIHLTQIPVK
jgi:hypothetical protein